MANTVIDVDELRLISENLNETKNSINRFNTVLRREVEDTIGVVNRVIESTSKFYKQLSDGGKSLSEANKLKLQDLAVEYSKLDSYSKQLESEFKSLKNIQKKGLITQNDLQRLQTLKSDFSQTRSDMDSIINGIEGITKEPILDKSAVSDYGRVIDREYDVVEYKRENLRNSKAFLEAEQRFYRRRKREEKEERDRIRREDQRSVLNAVEKTKQAINSTKNVYDKLDKDPIGAIGDGLTGLLDVSIGGLGKAFFGPAGEEIGKLLGNTIGSIATSVAKTILDRDNTMHKMIGILGLSGHQLEAYKYKTNIVTQSISKAWGKNLGDIVNAQIKYQEATGKSILLSEDMLNSHFALSKVAGDENAMGFTSGLEYFNYNVKDSADLYYELYKNASKMGLNTQKMTKDMVENLKLAQKYNFKGGVQNMLEMTILAQKIGLSLSSVTGVAEKIIEGGLEGVIEQAAQLQVLGGARAKMANPLSMLYESFNNVGDLMTRVKNMTEGLGRWDNKTRQIRFDNVVDELMVRQVSKVLGISQEEIKSMRNTISRREDIQKEISRLGLSFSESFQESIKNKALFNHKTNSYEVTTISGQRLGLHQLKEEYDKFLVSNPEGSTIEEFAKANMSLTDKVGASVTALKNGFGVFVYDNFGELIMNGIDSIAGGLDWFTEKTKKDHTMHSSKTLRELNLAEKEFIAYEKANNSKFNTTRPTLFGNQTITHSPSDMVYSEGFVEHKYRSERDSVRIAKEKILRDKANRSIKERYDSNLYSVYDVNSSSVSAYEARDSRSNFERDILRTVSNSTVGNGSMDINMSGTIKLEGGDQSVDITEVLRRNPSVMKQVADGVVDQMGRSVNGGRTNLFSTENVRSIYR